MSKNNGGPAFPVYCDADHFGASGMTLRDYFAAKAMQGIYACPVQLYRADGTPMPDPLTSADIAKMAYEEADAMLAEREKETQTKGINDATEAEWDAASKKHWRGM